MKYKNKKTGEIVDLEPGQVFEVEDTDELVPLEEYETDPEEEDWNRFCQGLSQWEAEQLSHVLAGSRMYAMAIGAVSGAIMGFLICWATMGVFG